MPTPEQNRKYRANYRQKHPDLIKAEKHNYYLRHKRDILEKRKQYALENGERIANYQEKYRIENREVLIQKDREYKKKNIDKYRINCQNRLKNDVQYRLSKVLRSRMNKAISRNQKAGSAIKDLGCSIPELKFYLEGQFLPGMTWENHGEWHIDHIIPLAFFNLSDREQFLKACHYTNLQPLWAKDNLDKRMADGVFDKKRKIMYNSFITG